MPSAPGILLEFVWGGILDTRVEQTVGDFAASEMLEQGAPSKARLLASQVPTECDFEAGGGSEAEREGGMSSFLSLW